MRSSVKASNTNFAMSAPSKPQPHSLNNDFELLEVSWISPGVVQVALNRPRKRNAMNAQLWREIGRAFCKLGTTGDDCRCIVLKGNGACFSAGIDITDPSFMMTGDDDVARNAMAFQPKILDMQACFTALEECPVPVIAAIHGNCIGGGIDLICAADMRFCSQDAVFSVREVRLGLAADVGTLQRLPKIIGSESMVRELCLTGRNFDAHSAMNIGLVGRVAKSHDDLGRLVLDIATDIAKHSPIAVRGTKKALVYARDHTVRDSLEQVASYNATALQNPDLAAAWTAKSTNSRPEFESVPPHSRL